MRNTVLAALFWWFLGTSVPGYAEIRGGTEVSVVQGQVSRWSVSARPEPGTEARAWWTPDRGASGWLRWGPFQVGPLVVVAAPEGRRAWGPGTRLSSGYWGLALDSLPLGLWAVQTPASLEAGAQLRGEWGAWAGAFGADRVWSLEAGAETPWSDRCRAGGGWALADWEAAAEVQGAREGEAPWEWQGEGRARWSSAGWEASASVATSASGGLQPAAASLAWSDREAGFRASFRTTRPASRLWWTVGGVGGAVTAEVDWRTGAGQAGLEAKGRLDQGRWQAGWEVRWGEVLVQDWTASWSLDRFQAEASWQVEGRRLGWMGPGSRVDLTLRWFW